MAGFKKGVSGNAAGRPKGTRNKTAIQKAQDKADAGFTQQVEMWQAIATRNPEGLAKFGLTASDVKVTHMLDASKHLASLVSSKNVVLGEKPDAQPVKTKPVAESAKFSTVAALKPAAA